jgi:hypothetical protein
MGKQSICGFVANQADAEKIILSLVDAGINPNEISILSPQENGDGRQSRNWRTENRSPVESFDWKSGNPLPGMHSKIEKNTHSAEGATAGAMTGGFLGGTLGLLAGIGALAIPGNAPLLAAGPLMAALSGIGAGGTIGSILGALIGAGIPEKEAQRYEGILKRGSILLSACAHSESQAKCIIEIFQQQGAQNVRKGA